MVAVLAVLLIVAGVGLTVLLAATTSFGLLGLPLVVFGLLMVFGVRIFPSRTAKGYGTLRRVLGFKRFIDESEKERAQFAERQNLFSEYLPYAVVFGATDKWARAFAGSTGSCRTDWYVSDQLFTVALFSQAMGGFTTTPPAPSLRYRRRAAAAGSAAARAAAASAGAAAGRGDQTIFTWLRSGRRFGEHRVHPLEHVDEDRGHGPVAVPLAVGRHDVPRRRRWRCGRSPRRSDW